MVIVPRLRPFDIDEFTGRLLLGAINSELSRLKVKARAHQDKADREGWAFYKTAIGHLHLAQSSLQEQLECLGSPTKALQIELARSVRRRRSSMYPTKAGRAVKSKQQRAAVPTSQSVD